MSNNNYQLTSNYLMLADEENDVVIDLESHINNGNYFLSLSTQLDMISQELPEGSYASFLLKKTLQELKHLQENYKIIRKTEE